MSKEKPDYKDCGEKFNDELDEAENNQQQYYDHYASEEENDG